MRTKEKLKQAICEAVDRRRGEIEKIVKEVISKNKKAVEDYKSGKEAAVQYLIGQIMVQTKGKANPQLVKAILQKTLTKTQ